MVRGEKSFRKVMKKLKYIEVLSYEHLVTDPKARGRLSKIKLKHTERTFRKKPKLCLECGCKSMVSILVLGGHKRPMLWMCDECEELFLRYTPSYTSTLLKKASKYWVVSRQWGGEDKPIA
jgi:hypothetical protein